MSIPRRRLFLLCVFTMNWSWETDRVVDAGGVALCLVFTNMGAGAHCVRTYTVEEAERRCGQGCGKPSRVPKKLFMSPCRR